MQQTDLISQQASVLKDLHLESSSGSSLNASLRYFTEAQKVLESFPVGRLAVALDQAYRVNRMASRLKELWPCKLIRGEIVFHVHLPDHRHHHHATDLYQRV